MPAKFTMPKVHVGQPILWTHDKNRLDSAVAAIVTKVGPEAINVIFFPPDSGRGTPRDGVRHIADPGNDRINSDAGVWEFTEDHKQRLDLDHRLAKLEARAK